jgi:hypothetical protein
MCARYRVSVVDGGCVLGIGSVSEMVDVSAFLLVVLLISYLLSCPEDA